MVHKGENRYSFRYAKEIKLQLRGSLAGDLINSINNASLRGIQKEIDKRKRL